MSTTTNPAQFAFLSRILHWLMAALIVAMLFIGVSMVSSLGDYHWLLALHRPLGILILILAAIRLITRLLTRAPALPANIAPSERLAIKVSELMLYTLFIALPLVGWAMLSAARYPIVMWGSLHLFNIVPHNVMLYAALRKAHTILAYLLFLAFIAHFGAVLFHTLVVRDRLLNRMVPWRARAS